MTELCTPNPVILLESLRSIGYEFETAVADIIDNSIAAGANVITINCIWDGSNSSVIIGDNGKGMNGEEILDAMRLGSQNPQFTRSTKDLGRFGLGLKTASLSQCRKFTVISKAKGYMPVYRCWSLDHVAKVQKWETLCDIPKIFDSAILKSTISGTWVVWEQLDRIAASYSKDNSEHESTWSAYIAILSKHLSMVFHRYIEDGLKIIINDRKIDAWDPFLSGEKYTQVLPEEQLENGLIRIRPYILPHQAYLSPDKFRESAGIKGWNAHQGFYIYRNKRLLVAGGWIDGIKIEEHCKLARVLVDLPNTLDFDWQIDIRKAQALPPDRLIKEIKRIASTTRSRAKEVYAVRGKVIQHSAKLGFIPVWNFKIRQGHHSYLINREHPAVATLKSLLAEQHEETKALKSMLRIIEEAIPVPMIAMKESEEPEASHKPFDGDDSMIKPLFDQVVLARRNLGDSAEVIKSYMSKLEPFNRFVHLLETIK